MVLFMWQVIFGMLVDNKLNLRAYLGMLFTASELKFLLGPVLI